MCIEAEHSCHTFDVGVVAHDYSVSADCERGGQVDRIERLDVIGDRLSSGEDGLSHRYGTQVVQDEVAVDEGPAVATQHSC